MIESVKVLSGYASELPNLKDRTFEFVEDKINVLFGPNGCGKTTILKVAAGYTGLHTGKGGNGGGGWSHAPSHIGFDPEYPKDFRKTTTGEVEADVKWDGSLCFYNSAGLSEGGHRVGYFVESTEESPDGMMDMSEQMRLLIGHFSEGELRLYKIQKLVEAFKKPPKVNLEPEPRDSRSTKAYKAYLKTLPRTGPMTLLWDEPDRSLNIQNQIDFWTKFLPSVGDKVQVIVATHSAIPLLLPPHPALNIIDVEPGYFQQNRTVLRGLASLETLV